jgi:site-specific DNA-methyltransferase (adenine-specific)
LDDSLRENLPAPYYQDSAVTIYCGDCRQILPFLGRFDLLLTDPPYGIKADRIRDSQKYGWRDYGRDTNWDHAPPANWVIEMLLSFADKAIIWGGNYFSLPPSMGWLVWDKGQRDFSLADCELAWTSERRATRIFNYSRATALQDGKQHPTQKPEKLMTWCITQAEPVTTILDPFAGSGTTGRAAKDLGKKATLIEREERYCEIAAKRMSQEVLSLWAAGDRPNRFLENGDLFSQIDAVAEGTNEGTSVSCEYVPSV